MDNPMTEMLALELPSTLSTRLHKLAQAAALPVDRFVVQALEATLQPDAPVVAPPESSWSAPRQEAVLMILRRMAGAAQARMDELMARNTEGQLTPAEEAELKTLVNEYEQIMLANSEQLLRIQQANPQVTGE
jgi:predicted transcriptional regulator